MVKFVADSSCDMLEMEGVNFESVPLTIYTDENAYVDDENIDIHKMLGDLEAYKGKSHTSCPSVQAWLHAFEGCDRIYVVTITSKLSGAYNSAMVAREMYLYSNPEAKVHVFDTKSTGPEMRLLLEKLVELDSSGMSFEEVCACGAEYLKKTYIFYALKSLRNLAQNGRVSKVVAAAAGVLGIRVVGTASEEGELAPLSKCRGEKKTVLELMNQLDNIGFSKGKIRLGHTENPELVKIISDALKIKYPQADIKTYEARGLCSYYGERGAIFIGAEVL